MQKGIDTTERKTNNLPNGAAQSNFTMHLRLILYFLSCGFCTSNISNTVDNFEKFLVQLSEYFEFDCVSIVCEDESADLLRSKQFFKTNQVQIVREKQLETLIRNVGPQSQCTYFMFAQNQEYLQDLVNEILSIDQNILNYDSWFIVSWEIPEISAKLDFDSEVTIVLNTSDSEFDLVEMYDLGDRKRIVRTYNSWREGLEMEVENKLERRKDLMGTHFRAVFLPWTTFIWLSEPGKDSYTPEEWFGLVPDIFNSFARQLNFTYSIALSRDGYWGAVDKETGRWNGIIGDVVDGVADIAVAVLSVTKTRSEVADFMIPFYSDQFGFFISKESSYTWNTYFEPFMYESWVVLLAMLILIALSLAMVARVGKDKSIKEFTLEKCFIYVFGAYGGFAIRRWSITPVNISTR